MTSSPNSDVRPYFARTLLWTNLAVKRESPSFPSLEQFVFLRRMILGVFCRFLGGSDLRVAKLQVQKPEVSEFTAIC